MKIELTDAEYTKRISVAERIYYKLKAGMMEEANRDVNIEMIEVQVNNDEFLIWMCDGSLLEYCTELGYEYYETGSDCNNLVLFEKRANYLKD